MMNSWRSGIVLQPTTSWLRLHYDLAWEISNMFAFPYFSMFHRSARWVKTSCFLGIMAFENLRAKSGRFFACESYAIMDFKSGAVWKATQTKYESKEVPGGSHGRYVHRFYVYIKYNMIVYITGYIMYIHTDRDRNDHLCDVYIASWMYIHCICAECVTHYPLRHVHQFLSKVTAWSTTTAKLQLLDSHSRKSSFSIEITACSECSNFSPTTGKQWNEMQRLHTCIDVNTRDHMLADINHSYRATKYLDSDLVIGQHP